MAIHLYSTNTNSTQANAASGKSTSKKVGESSKTNDSKEVKSDLSASDEEDKAAVYEKNSKSSVNDPKAVTQMLRESDQKAESLKKLVDKLLSKQTEKFYSSYSKDGINEESLNGHLKDFFSNLEVDEETAAQAKKDISEDGYYGVAKTSERILNFAKALAGNDPEKIDKMEAAVMKGFEDAKKMWGDEMPEITKQTLDAVKKGFQDWRNEIGASNTANSILNQSAASMIAGN